MATFAPVLLSGSTNGRPVLVAATATPGTTIHTVSSTTGVFDEITLWAQNTDTIDRKLTIEFGGVTSPNDLLEMTIPAEAGALLVVDGVRLTGGVVVRAFAASANLVTLIGNVNRYTP